MLGINYESSDEDEATKPEVSHTNIHNRGAIATNTELTETSTTIAPTLKTLPAPVEQPSVAPGPVNETTQHHIVSSSLTEEDLTDGVPPYSPHASNRLTIQHLTLPTSPNWNIPPSPPGSPPHKSLKKFTQFLELKMKGQHFNQRLENSSVLRDPNHLRKLLDFVGVGAEDLYASSLPDDLGIPHIWPEWAYSDELNASQKRIAKAKQEERAKVPRDSVDFVPARSAMSSGTGTPAKGPRQSAAERVMAGLDRQSARSTSQGAGKRKDLEHRVAKTSSGIRWQSRSRSPKRRRSRSRERR